MKAKVRAQQPIPEYMQVHRWSNDIDEDNRRRLVFIHKLSAAVLYRAIDDFKKGSKEALVFLKSNKADYWCNHANISPSLVREKLAEVRKGHLIRKRDKYFKPNPDNI